LTNTSKIARSKAAGNRRQNAEPTTEPAPAKWAAFLTTDDKTDLSAEEIKACQGWRFSVTQGRPAVITLAPDARPYFDEWRGDWGVPDHPPIGDLHDYQITFLDGASHD
jgi:hypothetical protein